MGKKIYSSGVMPSDFVEDRPRGDDNTLSIAQPIGAPVCDVQTRMLAAVVVLKKLEDADEVLEALGLDLLVEKRREVLQEAGRKVLR